MPSSDRKVGITKKGEKNFDFNQSDIIELDEFSSAVNYEDVKFEEWLSHHRKLDLFIHVVLNHLEARDGCSKEIQFSRCVRSEGCCGKKVERIKVKKIVVFAENSQDGNSIVLPCLGDQREMKVGDAIIIVKIV